MNSGPPSQWKPAARNRWASIRPNPWNGVSAPRWVVPRRWVLVGATSLPCGSWLQSGWIDGHEMDPNNASIDTSRKFNRFRSCSCTGADADRCSRTCKTDTQNAGAPSNQFGLRSAPRCLVTLIGFNFKGSNRLGSYSLSTPATIRVGGGFKREAGPIIRSLHRMMTQT